MEKADWNFMNPVCGSGGKMIVLKGAEVTARIKQQVEEALSGWKGEAPKLAMMFLMKRVR